MARKQASRSAYAKLLWPSADLAAIVGDEPINREEATKRVWDYIANKGLQDRMKRTMINADATLKAIVIKPRVSLFELTKHLNAHLSAEQPEQTRKTRSIGASRNHANSPNPPLLRDIGGTVESDDTETELGDWSDDELRASVAAYQEMQRLLRDSPSGLNKKETYRGLAARFGRTAKAFEFRMQNISAVLALLGRDWLPGLKPAMHVGKSVAERIERLLSEADGVASSGQVGFEIAVRESQRRRSAEPPAGTSVPSRVASATFAFVRDPVVKAWVLNRASGACESCGDPAPFKMPDGQPFLEVHHLRKLADGGSDRVSNAVALCPNCHRRMHYGIDAADLRSALLGRVPGLQAE